VSRPCIDLTGCAGHFASVTHTLSRITEFVSWEINKANQLYNDYNKDNSIHPCDN